MTGMTNELAQTRAAVRSGLGTARFIPEKNARTGKLLDSGKVADDPRVGLTDVNQIWIRIGATKDNPAGRHQTVAWNYDKVATDKADLPVVVVEDKSGDWYVDRADNQAASSYGAPAGFFGNNAARPPETNKSTILQIANLLDLKPYYGGAGLQLRTKPGWLPNGSYWTDDSAAGVADLSSAVTVTSGQWAYAVAGIDLTDNTWHLDGAGDRSLAVKPIPFTDIAAVLMGWTGILPIAAVPLANGAVAFTHSDIVDLRGWATGASGGGGSIDTLAAVDRGLSIDATDPTNLLIATRPTDLDNADTLVRLDATLNEDVRPLRLSAGAKRVRLEDMTGMGDPDVTNPVVALGTGGASDTKIRELGNILYEPWEATRKYKMTYTGWVAGEATDEKIHYAYSEDGKTWTKYASNPIISGRRAEDPYVVKVDGVYYLFAEDKTANTISTSFIRRWHSTDFTSWADDGQVQGIGTDAQSPLVWYDGARWYLLYEHHPTSPLDVRLAYSDDGLNFVDEASNPVFSASQTTSAWCVDTVVCDDLIKVGEQWVMSYHGQDSGAIWREGLAFSRDLLMWIDSPHSPLPDYVAGIHADTMMFLYDTVLTLFYEDDNVSGIYRGFPVLADSTAKTLASDVLTADKDFHIVAAQSGTADNLATISGGKAGQLLVLRADAGDTITVKDSTGNITLGAGTDFTLSGDKSLLLYLQAGTWYDVGGTGADINPATIHASELATRWEPLIFDSEIVFYDGDIVMVEVAN